MFLLCVPRKLSFWCNVFVLVFSGHNPGWSDRHAIGRSICLHDLSTLGTITSHIGTFVWISCAMLQPLLLFHWTFISFHCFKFWYQFLLILCIWIKVSSCFSKCFWLQTRRRKCAEDDSFQQLYHFHKHVVSRSTFGYLENVTSIWEETIASSVVRIWRGHNKITRYLDRFIS